MQNRHKINHFYGCEGPFPFLASDASEVVPVVHVKAVTEEEEGEMLARGATMIRFQSLRDLVTGLVITCVPIAPIGLLRPGFWW